ncbi:MAG: glycerate kinase [Nitrospirae bacterium RIFCSPLOWO2_02_FULL_62_14]|nr:MAG: glycerate kinase [Nitrospirae bacterium RIFCSPLOWO2_02_FULL_62_14]OGW70533.1 MAG: glycerate kinase [Nitrospirae bacterium RIFCSPLOWO2_01_FULL_62_17]OGW93548.1 MAG: glycerate kinase [Nitrospirae bacterium RIFCSPLOWO2_12_FULL_63_8]
MRIGVQEPRARALLGRLLRAGLAAVDPRQAVSRVVSRTKAGVRIAGRRYDVRGSGKIVAVGAGKASAAMALALEQRLGARLAGGLVAVKRGAAAPAGRITVVTAGHPVPDQAGRKAAMQVLALVKGLTRDDLLIVLLSGGASSLLPLPAPGLTLADTQKTTELLLNSGAAIREINAVRKHLSAITGGRLAAVTGARVVTLILSDVIGDDLGAIGSGPTAPDPTTYADACAILRRFHIWNLVPVRVRRHLLRGRRGSLDETPKPGARLFRRVRHHVLGNNRTAVEAVCREAVRAGLRPHVLSRPMTGDVREAAASFGRLAHKIVSCGKSVRPPACLIAGGEPTVVVRGRGRGGRAQEFALAAAMGIAGLPNIRIAGFGTDGSDGPTDAAGAVVDGGTVARAAQQGMDAAAFLRRHNAYSFFKRAGGHIVTGPTGTNVNDLYLMIVL